ncbi:MAG: T9SS type A sorting domain-containing protein [Bacteroidota bacterium]
MKTILPKLRRIMHPVSDTILALVLLTLVQSPVKAGSLAAHNYKDSILVNKLLTSKKYKVKIYPGASNEVLFFTASGEEGKVYQLFLFDIEGNMVKQTQIRNKQTTILTNFNKGSYTFEVFSDDEHIENGTLTIK